MGLTIGGSDAWLDILSLEDKSLFRLSLLLLFGFPWLLGLPFFPVLAFLIAIGCDLAIVLSRRLRGLLLSTSGGLIIVLRGLSLLFFLLTLLDPLLLLCVLFSFPGLLF